MLLIFGLNAVITSLGFVVLVWEENKAPSVLHGLFSTYLYSNTFRIWLLPHVHCYHFGLSKKTPQIAQIMLQPLLTWHHTSAPTGWGLSDHTSPVCSIEKMTELWGGSCVSSWRTSASKPWCWILCLLFFPDQELFLLLPKLASCPRALGPPLSHPFPLLILTSPLLSLASPVLPSTGSIPNSILTGCYFSHLKNRTKQNDQPIKQKQLFFLSFFYSSLSFIEI